MFFFLNSEPAYDVHVSNKGILWNVDRNLKVRSIQKVYGDKISSIKKYLNLKPISHTSSAEKKNDMVIYKTHKSTEERILFVLS